MILNFEDYTKDRLDEDVIRFQNYYNFHKSNTEGKNDELDAFRYAYKSAYIAYYYSDRVAKKQFEANLKTEPNYNRETLNETGMKMWNSRVGREIAKSLKHDLRKGKYTEKQIKSMLAYSIVENMRDNKMIVSLNDIKNYDDFDKIYYETSEETAPPASEKLLEGMVKENNYQQVSHTTYTTTPTAAPEYEYVKTPCIGSYPVSGYIRKNGTEVDSYTRNCGAKHIAKVKRGNIQQTSRIRKSEKSHTPIKLNAMEKIQRYLGRKNPLPNSTFIYYKKALNLARGEDVSDENNKVTKFSDFENGKLKDFIKEKTIKSRTLHEGMSDFQQRIDNSYIITAKEGAKITQQVVESQDFNKFIQAHLENIKAGKYKDKVISYEFKKPPSEELLSDKGELYLVLHNIDIYNLRINEKGDIEMDIIDDYNFDHWEKSGNLVTNILIDINNRAHQQQLANKLTPYILHIPITLKKAW